MGSHVRNFFQDKGINFRSISRQEMDITDREAVLHGISGVDCIVHLAGMVNKESGDPQSYFDVNAVGTLNILESAQKQGVKKIIIASTVEVYSDILPSGLVSESDIYAPTSYYGQSKLLAENYCVQYAKKFGFDCFILRFGYLYGKGMHPTRVFSRIAKAVQNHSMLELKIEESDYFDALYVKDAARAVWQSLSCEQVGTQIMNIASGKKISIKEMVETIQSQHPDFFVQYIASASSESSYHYDITKAGRIISFKPHYSLGEGLQEFLKII